MRSYDLNKYYTFQRCYVGIQPDCSGGVAQIVQHNSFERQAPRNESCHLLQNLLFAHSTCLITAHNWCFQRTSGVSFWVLMCYPLEVLQASPSWRARAQPRNHHHRLMAGHPVLCLKTQFVALQHLTTFEADKHLGGGHHPAQLDCMRVLVCMMNILLVQ